MDIQKAKEIVQLLADGIDPVTGELLPKDSIYNEPEVIRALHTVINSIRIPRNISRKTKEEKQKENLENGKPKNAGLPWDEESKSDIAQMFKSGKTPLELSEYFERTTSAITSELKHQGLIT